VDPEHYFWVRPINDPCGECFDTPEEAVAEAKKGWSSKLSIR
jgi:hypothetical protein